MKFIARHLNFMGLLLLAGFTAAAAGLYFDVPQKIQGKQSTTAPAAIKQKSGCCVVKAQAEPTPAPAACPHMAAATEASCGDGCSHH